MVNNQEINFREIGTIQIPALERPTNQRRTVRDMSPIEAVTLKLETIPVLLDSEKKEKGTYSFEERYEKRIVPKLESGVLGMQQADWLSDRIEEFPGLVSFLDKYEIDFPGIILRDAWGKLCCPCLTLCFFHPYTMDRVWKVYWRQIWLRDHNIIALKAT